MITVKCSNLSSKTIFKSDFHLQNTDVQFGEAVFAVVMKVSASAYLSSSKYYLLDSDFCYSCINGK